MNLYVYYRISDKGNLKDKLPWADKYFCLSNALKIFGKETFHIIADNCSSQTVDFIKAQKVSFEETSLGNAASFVYMMDKIIQKHTPDDYVYLIEDDYIHRLDSREILLEGLDIADYVSLYDHPDKYFLDESGGGNPFNYKKLWKTRVYITKSTHWREINSSTMTFACRVKTLQEDYTVWKKYCNISKTPKDFHAFITLTVKGVSEMISFIPRFLSRRGEIKILCKNLITRRKTRKLISVIPAYATHTDIKWTAPCIDWEHIE
jgi:hypothetical protein